MTLLAARPKLTLVNIGVTIGTFCSHIRKDGLGVARNTGHIFVQAAKREPRLIVIKLGTAADRLPPTKCVAILAGNIQRTMRAMRCGVGLRPSACGNKHHQR